MKLSDIAPSTDVKSMTDDQLETILSTANAHLSDGEEGPEDGDIEDLAFQAEQELSARYS
jgi:hypothetical protein